MAAYRHLGNGIFVGLTTDTKPTAANTANGAIAIEWATNYATFIIYVNNQTAWLPQTEFTETIKNKTYNTTDNTLTATSQAAGDILYNNATKFVRLGIGTANQLLRTNSGATAPEWASTLSGLTLTAPVISTISNTGTITLPTSTDTLVGKATTDTLTNKTLDVAGTGNSLTATSAAVGDILHIASGTSFARLGIGTSNLGTTAGIPARQALMVNSAGTDVIWNDPFGLPSSGRLWGVRQGFAGGSVSSTIGTGMLNGITVGNGTGAATAFGTDTTDGPRSNSVTGTSNVFARAGWWGTCGTARKYNPTLTIRFRLGAAQTSSNAMLYIGFVNQSAQPTAGTSMLATYLNTKIGALFGFRPADTTWMFMSNNAIATATYTAQTGLPNSGATDNTVHTLSITLNDTVPNINWSFDGVAQTTITDTTNNVPPSTTVVYPIYILEAQSATSLSILERWSQLSQDAP